MLMLLLRLLVIVSNVPLKRRVILFLSLRLDSGGGAGATDQVVLDVIPSLTILLEKNVMDRPGSIAVTVQSAKYRSPCRVRRWILYREPTAMALPSLLPSSRSIFETFQNTSEYLSMSLMTDQTISGDTSISTLLPARRIPSIAQT